MEPPDSDTVGKFIDEKTGVNPSNPIGRRTPQAVAGRLLEEVAELAAELYMPLGVALQHIVDAYHNEALKLSSTVGFTVYPSQVEVTKATLENRDLVTRDIAIAGEISDIRLVTKDLCYVLGFLPARVNAAEAIKWNAFTHKQFHVSASGCLYAVKPHFITPNFNKPVTDDARD